MRTRATASVAPHSSSQNDPTPQLNCDRWSLALCHKSTADSNTTSQLLETTHIGTRQAPSLAIVGTLATGWPTAQATTSSFGDDFQQTLSAFQQAASRPRPLSQRHADADLLHIVITAGPRAVVCVLLLHRRLTAGHRLSESLFDRSSVSLAGDRLRSLWARLGAG